MKIFGMTLQMVAQDHNRQLGLRCGRMMMMMMMMIPVALCSFYWMCFKTQQCSSTVPLGNNIQKFF